MLNNIYIHPITYITILISFLAGYFEIVFILLMLILIHEIGHMTSIVLFNYNIDKIIIYPFGGLTKYDALLNSSIYKEIIILLSGPLFQLIFYFIIYILNINGYVNSHIFDIFHKINLYLLCFNFLPILPLDGGKVMNLILDMFFSYNLSHIISIVISIITMITFMIFNFNIFYLLLFIILIKSIINEIVNHKIRINKFLLERYIYKLKQKKGKIINNIMNVRRGKTHKIKQNNKIYEESEYLKIQIEKVSVRSGHKKRHIRLPMIQC